MHFAPDTEESLDFVVALANTVAGATKSGADEIATVEQLHGLIGRFPFSGRIDRDADELAGVRDTRDWIRRIWTLDRENAVAAVNTMLRESNAVPQLVRHDGIDWHIHATDESAPLAERILVEVGLALVDVIRSDEMGRLRRCAADDCDGVLIDLSRNGSKRFCSVRCGNRVNMIAFRGRNA